MAHCRRASAAQEAGVLWFEITILQHLADDHGTWIGTRARMRRNMPAPFASFKSLADFHLYTLGLRTHGMSHLTVSDQIHRNKELGMHALKRHRSAKADRTPSRAWSKGSACARSPSPAG